MRLTKKNIANFIFNSNGIEGYYTPEKPIIDILEGKVSGKSPLILNQIECIEYIKEHKKEIPSIENIVELHGTLLRNIDKWAGKIRDGDVFVGGRKAPDSRNLRTLLKHWIHMWDKKLEKPQTQKEAALNRHYEFEYIHPFFDGNGRCGRLLHLWDCLYHKTNLDVIQTNLPEKLQYYREINNYVLGRT